MLAYLVMASSCGTGDEEDGYLLEYEKSCQASEATGEQIETDSELDDILVRSIFTARGRLF